MNNVPRSDDPGTIVYVVVSHTNPPQVLRLVRVLTAGDPTCQVVVRHDDSSCPLEPPEFADDARVHFIAPPCSHRWGRYPIVEIILDSFRWALANLDFDWLVLLTGQTYPLEPPSSFRARLAGSSCDAFVSAHPIPSSRPEEKASETMYMYARYFYRWYELPYWLLRRPRRLSHQSPLSGRVLRSARRRFSFGQPLIFLWSLPRDAGDMIGIRRFRVPFGPGFECYFGLPWMTLSRRAVEVIERFIGARPELERFYRRSILPAESILVTSIYNSPELQTDHRDHNYVRMTGGGQAHAAVISRQELDAAFASGKSFARKLDERVDRSAVDSLDDRIGAPQHDAGSVPEDERVVVYLILSHDNPAQIKRLVRVLREAPHSYVIVQHDQKRTPLDPNDYASDPRVHVMAPSREGRRWGRYSLVEAMLDAYRWALANLDFSWVVMVSGQDYPLAPPADFQAQLSGSSCDAFLTATPTPLSRPSSDDSVGIYMHARYCYKWYELPPWVMGWMWRSDRIARLARAAQRRISLAQPLIFLWSLPKGGGDMVGIRRARIPFSDAFRCYFGSQWLTLSRRAVEAIARFVDDRPDVVRLYRRSLIPDESLPVTILCNSPELTVEPDNHLYARMTGPGEAHAAVLGSADLEEAFASGKPFARKLDERVDPLALDLLDERIRAHTGSRR